MAASRQDLQGLPGWPRLLTLEMAAAYLSTSTTTFKAWVAEKRMPPPVDMPGRIPRWNRVAIDQQVDALSALRRQNAVEDELIRRAVNGEYTLPR